GVEFLISAHITHLIGRQPQENVLALADGVGQLCQKLRHPGWSSAVLDIKPEAVCHLLRNLRPEVLEPGADLDLDGPPVKSHDDVHRAVSMRRPKPAVIDLKSIPRQIA